MSAPATNQAGLPRVLVVDDRTDNLLAMRAVLEPLGIELVEAGSGEEALKALLEGDFAVILLDVHMPGMDGFETAAMIKSRARSRETPIIFLTAAQADLEQAAAGYEAGGVDFLLKPFDPVILRSKVAVFADLDRQRRALARSDELVRTAFEAAPSGMALCDAEGRVVQANPALRGLVGARAAVGARATEFLSPADGDRLAAWLRDRCTPGPAAPERVSWLATAASSEGVPIPVFVIATALRDAHDDAVQFLVTVRDERDRQIARTLQAALLPERLPSVAGLSLAAHVSPGGHGTQVGGDWYDAIALSGGRLGIVVGDVAGRGIEAAARMGELRSVARAYALEGHEPVALVERMNGYHAALGADLMTTLLFAIFEVDSGTMRFVNAGHPPPVVAMPGGDTRLLRGAGPPLGVLDTWRYEEQTIELPHGALALLYTDGLVERRGESLDEGLERLRAAVAAEGGGMSSVCARLIEAMDAHSADDDVTCVAVRTEPLLGPAVQLKLAPDPRSLVLLRRVLHRWLAEAGAERDEAGEIVMAANEAWQNALEHGTGFARTTVDVELEVRDDEVSICVRDAGRRERDPSDPDRGRGIELMRALADEVRLELAPHGSAVRLRRRLRSGATAGGATAADERVGARLRGL